MLNLLYVLNNFKNLEIVSVVDNPFTEENEYKNYFYANLSNLKYLNYCFIN